MGADLVGAHFDGVLPDPARRTRDRRRDRARDRALPARCPVRQHPITFALFDEEESAPGSKAYAASLAAART
jgi:hypothetical protein